MNIYTSQESCIYFIINIRIRIKMLFYIERLLNVIIYDTILYVFTNKITDAGL
jgi:hypothetical protein